MGTNVEVIEQIAIVYVINSWSRISVYFSKKFEIEYGKNNEKRYMYEVFLRNGLKIATA